MKDLMALIWFASCLENDHVWIHTKRGEAITNAMRAPVRPATRWMQMASLASGNVRVPAKLPARLKDATQAPGLASATSSARHCRPS
jgi:hypothetical protein